MEFSNNRYAFVKRVAVSYALAVSTTFAMAPINYAFPMGGEKSWKVTGNPIRCGLSLTIPNYGIGYFEQFAAQPPHFVLRKWDEVSRPLPARIIARAPMWKPDGATYMVGSLMVNPGAYGIFLKRDSTLKLLTYLSQGYEPTFKYRSDIGFDVSVALTPRGFQTPYSHYQRCISNLLPFGFDRVKESVFHFAPDSRELTDQDKDQLRRIARYTAADHQIKVIRIIGYADESGRKGYNNAISQYRAQAVQNYLITLGVPEEQLSVTWLGALKPVARNDTDAGRAENRRVVVSLIKK